MIDCCPYCRRPVANDETIARTVRGVWVPTACCGRGGPREGEAVTNHLYWYTSIRDGAGRRRLVTGPFPNYDAAQAARGEAYRLVNGSGDPKAPFYAHGVASSNCVLPTLFGGPSEERP